ncbi:hypothetical protein EA83_02001 [Enterococcus faecium]|uniref:DUF1642 domain-containing protein n=1 Tax=Enterococcus faecium TaxID=1352 RepID=UPI000DEA1A7E|nr:DUF1642 domain-containing protein [Enterococcus faecium]EGP5186648.1 DUF1642 domain-containing protein [Enterococcus faecium]EME8230864.1 DUF1642 domain-containing protein [Enterococcus faecium]RBS99745.1 hypothetical protein EA83_02001 [Enterococcus faecium]
MNKQELIDKLAIIVGSIEDFKGISTFHDGKYAGLEHALELIKQLDEPQKPVVPKFVADWIELCKEKADLISCLSGSYEYGVNQYKRITEDEDWLFEADHQELVARAWLYGYEIEKEPLYTVTINLDRKYHLVVDEGDGNDEISTTLTTSHGVLGYRYFLTEKEIKSADENLWLIAVPVEEVAEG